MTGNAAADALEDEEDEDDRVWIDAANGDTDEAQSASSGASDCQSGSNGGGAGTGGHSSPSRWASSSCMCSNMQTRAAMGG